MASADGMQAMRAFEHDIWPRVEETERRFRRHDRFVGIASIIGIALIAAGTAVQDDDVLRGLCAGLLANAAFWTGITYQRILNRRAGYDQLRELHEQAQFTLSYHGDEP